MPRTLPSGISANYTQAGSQPGYLIRYYLKSGAVLRLTSLDADFVLSGETYIASDVEVPDLSWDGTVAPGARVTHGDMDLSLWSLALARQFDDARVEIDIIYAAATNESIANVFKGRCGGPQRSVDQRSGATFSLALVAEATYQVAPRERVQYVIDPKWLIPAGTIFDVNGQRWILDRPTTANG